MKHMKLGTYCIWPLVLALAAASGCLAGTTTDASSGPYYLVTLDSGADNQSVPAGSALGFRVRVTHAGTPASGALVFWAVTAGNGQVVNPSVVSDSLGLARATWMLGDAVGPNTLNVTTVDDSIVVHAQGVPGHPTELVRLSADTTAVAAGSPVNISVKTVDVFGNAVPGATVQWTASGSGLASQQSTTDSTGTARVVFQPTAKGTYTVNAILPGEASIVFFVNAS